MGLMFGSTQIDNNTGQGVYCDYVRVSHAGSGEVTITQASPESRTVNHSYTMENNSLVHDEVLSLFSMEDQTSPDQLQNIKAETKKNGKKRGRSEFYIVFIYNTAQARI